MVLYEYPFNEAIRTMLRLEHLFDRLGKVMSREAAIDHHFALVTLFEILDVASRADLKSDVLKELERHRAQLQSYRGHPNISEVALDEVTARIDSAYNALNQTTGKAGQSLTTNDWLMSVRSRISIPGGTCEFDLPAYYAWQQLPAEKRRVDLTQWTSCLMPLAQALQMLLGLVRDSGGPQKVVAPKGQFQQSLAQGKTFNLIRVRVAGNDGIVPEISGHRLMVMVRLMRTEADGRLRPSQEDGSFEITLCH